MEFHSFEELKNFYDKETKNFYVKVDFKPATKYVFVYRGVAYLAYFNALVDLLSLFVSDVDGVMERPGTDPLMILYTKGVATRNNGLNRRYGELVECLVGVQRSDEPFKYVDRYGKICCQEGLTKTVHDEACDEAGDNLRFVKNAGYFSDDLHKRGKLLAWSTGSPNRAAERAGKRIDVDIVIGSEFDFVGERFTGKINANIGPKKQLTMNDLVRYLANAGSMCEFQLSDNPKADPSAKYGLNMWVGKGKEFEELPTNVNVHAPEARYNIQKLTPIIARYDYGRLIALLRSPLLQRTIKSKLEEMYKINKNFSETGKGLKMFIDGYKEFLTLSYPFFSPEMAGLDYKYNELKTSTALDEQGKLIEEMLTKIERHNPERHLPKFLDYVIEEWKNKFPECEWPVAELVDQF